MISIKFFCSIVAMSIFCQTVKQDMVVITGKAANLKAGASVISNKDGDYYILDGLVYWDQKMVGKTITVRGELKIKEIEIIPAVPGVPISPEQGPGTKRIILKPDWKLFNKKNHNYAATKHFQVQ